MKKRKDQFRLRIITHDGKIIIFHTECPKITLEKFKEITKRASVYLEEDL